MSRELTFNRVQPPQCAGPAREVVWHIHILIVDATFHHYLNCALGGVLSLVRTPNRAHGLRLCVASLRFRFRH